MIVCSCRAISNLDFTDEIELYKRLSQDDAICGTCLQELEHFALIPHGVTTQGETNENCSNCTSGTGISWLR